MRASLREKTLVAASARVVSITRIMRAVEMRRSRGSSFDTVSFLTLMGRMRAATPMRRRTLMMLLPMTLPRRMSVLPLVSDEKETASSGAPVPKATMVRPMRSLLTLKLEATEEAPSTSQSAPLMRKTKPMMRTRSWRMISMTFILLKFNIIIADFW